MYLRAGLTRTGSRSLSCDYWWKQSSVRPAADLKSAAVRARRCSSVCETEPDTMTVISPDTGLKEELQVKRRLLHEDVLSDAYGGTTWWGAALRSADPAATHTHVRSATHTERTRRRMRNSRSHLSLVGLFMWTESRCLRVRNVSAKVPGRCVNAAVTWTHMKTGNRWMCVWSEEREDHLRSD